MSGRSEAAEERGVAGADDGAFDGVDDGIDDGVEDGVSRAASGSGEPESRSCSHHSPTSRTTVTMLVTTWVVRLDTTGPARSRAPGRAA